MELATCRGFVKGLKNVLDCGDSTENYLFNFKRIQTNEITESGRG